MECWTVFKDQNNRRRVINRIPCRSVLLHLKANKKLP